MDEYYHLINPHDPILANNLVAWQGRFVSLSFLREQDPNLSGARTPYEVFNRGPQKEEIFERIRQYEFPDCPSRMGSIYLFDNPEIAADANARWFGGSRVVLRAQIVLAPQVGRYDAHLLDSDEPEWEDNARRYWSGEMTVFPIPEVLVHGIVQLEDWEPYGRLL